MSRIVDLHKGVPTFDVDDPKLTAEIERYRKRDTSIDWKSKFKETKQRTAEQVDDHLRNATQEVTVHRSTASNVLIYGLVSLALTVAAYFAGNAYIDYTKGLYSPGTENTYERSEMIQSTTGVAYLGVAIMLSVTIICFTVWAGMKLTGQDSKITRKFSRNFDVTILVPQGITYETEVASDLDGNVVAVVSRTAAQGNKSLQTKPIFNVVFPDTDDAAQTTENFERFLDRIIALHNDVNEPYRKQLRAAGLDEDQLPQTIAAVQFNAEDAREKTFLNKGMAEQLNQYANEQLTKSNQSTEVTVHVPAIDTTTTSRDKG